MSIQPWVHVETLEEYSERFKDFAEFYREDGILQVTISWQGGPSMWSYQTQHALSQLWTAIGHDQENEVLILTCKDPYWICNHNDPESFVEIENGPKDRQFDCNITDTMNFVENFINDIEIPTIAAINGYGQHYEFAIMSDITLCDEDYVFYDSHFSRLVPGDGMYFAMKYAAGFKRANYFTMTTNKLDAQQALDWGIVNEVLPHDQLMPRAWELARQVMKSPRTTRRLTHELAIRPWRDALYKDERVHVLCEMYDVQLGKFAHDFGKMQGKIQAAVDEVKNRKKQEEK